MSDDVIPADGLIALVPARIGGGWRWWPVTGGALGPVTEGDPPQMDGTTVVTILVSAALAPVRDTPLPAAMPLPQALATARLSSGMTAFEAAAPHVAVAADGDRLLIVRAACSDMDGWLAACAAMGLMPQAMVPASLVLPHPQLGIVLGDLAGERLARTADAAFAGEDALLEALAGSGEAVMLDDAAIATRLLAVHAAPPLDLQQGAYAPRRDSFLLLPDWRGLARMAATAALLALALILVWIVKWNHDATVQERRALALVQKRFPAASDLDSAERMVSAEMIRRGTGAAGFSAPAAALLQAMRAVPAVTLRDLGYGSDGSLRFTAAAPRADDVNAVLIALQRGGWKVTVPPVLAPDPTGATVAAITLRAP